MIRKISIAGGVLGVGQTLQEMAKLSLAGSSNSFVRGFALAYSPEFWEGSIRSHWRFTPENEELLHGIDAQMEMLAKAGAISGDCDDAAILAGALAVAAGCVAQFVAVRAGDRSEFDHVFCEVAYRGQWWRIDPTAPVGADYNGWERWEFPI